MGMQLSAETSSSRLYSKITEELDRHGGTISSLACQLPVNPHALEEWLHCLSKPAPLALLDSIAQTLGQPEGWLYPEYMNDFLCNGKMQWRRIKPFLLRCMDLNRADLVHRVLSGLTDEPQHLPAVFKLAEELFGSGRKTEAVPLYRYVIETESKQHSERFAVSHYRWFRAEISQGFDLDRYREAAIRFAPYRSRLPEHDQLDALLHLTNTYFIIQQWDKVNETAEEMLSLTLLCLHLESERKVRDIRGGRLFPAERPLVVYYGQSFLLRGNALEKQGRYEEAFSYLIHYRDLSWFGDLDENGRAEVERLAVFAEANRLNLYILMGRFEYLLDYVEFLNGHADEKIPGLLTIIEAAIRYGENVDDVFPFFKEEVLALMEDPPDKESRGYYSLSFRLNRRIQLLYGLGVYHFQQELIVEGVDYLLWALRHALASHNENLAMACAAWFEKYRSRALDAQKEEFESIMKGVIPDAKMDFRISSGTGCSKRSK